MINNYMYDTALKLAKHGIPVFPLASNTTIPLKGSNGYKDATTDTKQLNLWFNNENQLNMGMALKPSHLLVVDMDENHENGFSGVESYKKLAERYGKLPVDTYIMNTPRHGTHWFYHYPDNLEIPSKPLSSFLPELKEYTGIDIVTYSTPAVNTVTTNGVYKEIPTYGKITPADAVDCPQWLLALLTEKAPHSNAVNNYQISGKTWTGKLLEAVFEPDAQGTRNVYLTSLCGKLLFTKAKPSVVYEALQTANAHLAKPLKDREVNGIFKSVLKRELAK